MNITDLPSTAVKVSDGVWTDAFSRTRFVLDPADSTLLLAREWTSKEVNDFNQAQASKQADHAALISAIAARVASLQDAKTATTSFATSETSRAATVGALPLAQVTPQAIRDELALVHTDLSQIATNQALILTSLIDLANVVSGTL